MHAFASAFIKTFAQSYVGCKVQLHVPVVDPAQRPKLGVELRRLTTPYVVDSQVTETETVENFAGYLSQEETEQGILNNHSQTTVEI